MGAKYQEGCVTRAKRKRGPDVWEYRWRENGQQHSTVLGTAKALKNETAAKKAADHLRMKINRAAVLPARVTFGMVAEHYKANELAEASDIKAHSTKQTDLGYLNNWILPKWKELELETLLAVEVEQWLKNLSPLMPGSKAKIRNIMSAVYSHAARYGWTQHNPISHVRQSAKRVRIPNVLSIEEATALLGAVLGLGWQVRLMVALAICTGLRRSEIVGLKWGDIDWGLGCANVSRGVVSQKLSNCKTEVSRKPVWVPKEIILELRRWHEETIYGDPEHWIFASSSKRAGAKRGLQPVWPATVMRYWIRPAAKKVGIDTPPGWGWHTFRHTYGTLLKANNEDVKTVQELMRHASSRTTMDVYVQGVTETKRAAQSRIVEQVLHGVTLGSASGAVN